MRTLQRNEPLWLTPHQVVAINRDEVEAIGESHCVLDEGLVDSACARPKHLWFICGEHDVIRLAATLALGIATNHAFLQGNHRTAKTACIMFIEANGYRWTMPDTAELGYWVEDLVDRAISESEFAELLRPHCSRPSLFSLVFASLGRVSDDILRLWLRR